LREKERERSAIRLKNREHYVERDLEKMKGDEAGTQLAIQMEV
jgi:hypothetical protein